MTERFTFDLIEEPWIPCIRAADGEVVKLGLRATLTQAHLLREITDPSPLVTAALHRLLLAILHRNLGPASMEAWADLWNAGRFDMTEIDAYFDAWQRRGRFDLLHPERPFYQTTAIHTDYANSVALLAHELLLGRPPTLFQQVPAGIAFTPAQAARTVVALQAFAVGGLIAYQSAHGEPASPFKSSQDAPLKKGAVILNRGESAFETLLLNLHLYNGEQSAPWYFDPTEDCTAWERDFPVGGANIAKWLATDRQPDGYLDLLTWQSRRIRLIPECDGEAVVVRSAVMMRGHGFPPGWREDTTETMLAFRAKRDAKPNDPEPWVPLTFDPDRALWRSSLALYRSVDKRTQRPRVADWLADLVLYGHLPQAKSYAVDVFGLGTNRAKIHLWRHERLPLPLALLNDADLATVVARALESVESVSRLLQPDAASKNPPARGESDSRRPFQVVADELLGLASRTKVRHREQDTTRGAQFIDSLGLEKAFWSRLGLPFHTFILALADEPSAALARWLDTVEATALDSFDQTMRNFDTSARALKAEALASQRFRHALKTAMEPHRQFIVSLTASTAM